MNTVGRALFVVTLLISLAANHAWAQGNGRLGPLERAASRRGDAVARVIVRMNNGADVADLLPAVSRAGGRLHRRLAIINSVVVNVPGNVLEGLSRNPRVKDISLDRPVYGVMERTGATVGADVVREALGFDGRGIGVAIIDSGVTSWHDDLSEGGSGQRVDTFVDFVNGRTAAYDDYGHGTHVAGIIAGSGVDSNGRRTGIAPASHVIALKVLDGHGAGTVSDIIAALDYVHAHRHALNIRVVNMSVGSGVYQSYTTDPLTVATRQLVEDGIVVVAAAGNAGTDPGGNIRYGGVTAPGNAPWVLTVGASSHMGTPDRGDDTIAAFSSRGPTGFDYGAKPDLVAPGVGIESLSDPASVLYSSKASYLLDGTAATSYRPYLSLSGTSMAAPVVAGTVALMLQANPALTPNAIKAILQYSSERYSGYDALTQGAGFLNAAGAVRLARAFADPSVSAKPDKTWNRRIVWANHSIRGGALDPAANAWATDVTWGDARTPGGELVRWGMSWGTSCADALCSSMTWGAPTSPNVVWGMRCGGDNCIDEWRRSTVGSEPVGTDDADTVVWGNSDTVVWGNLDPAADTVVWGNSGADTVVWGNAEGDTVVWGNGCSDSTCQPVIWGTGH